MCSYDVKSVLSRQNTFELNGQCFSVLPSFLFSRICIFKCFLLLLASIMRSVSSHEATCLRMSPSDGAAARNCVLEVISTQSVYDRRFPVEFLDRDVSYAIHQLLQSATRSVLRKQ